VYAKCTPEDLVQLCPLDDAVSESAVLHPVNDYDYAVPQILTCRRVVPWVLHQQFQLPAAVVHLGVRLVPKYPNRAQLCRE